MTGCWNLKSPILLVSVQIVLQSMLHDIQTDCACINPLPTLYILHCPGYIHINFESTNEMSSANYMLICLGTCVGCSVRELYHMNSEYIITFVTWWIFHPMQMFFHTFGVRWTFVCAGQVIKCFHLHPKCDKLLHIQAKMTLLHFMA
jgi:hypothetical protein